MADATTFISRMDKDESQADIHARQRRDALSRWKDIWAESTRMQRFANGDQWPEGDRRKLDNPQRKVARLTFDEVGVVLQTFSGREMTSRLERVYIARHPNAARQGEIMTAVDRAYMQATDAEQVVSAAFKDGPGIQGISAIRWELDTLNEKGGGIVLSDLPIWQCMADPEARAINLSDRAWHLYGKWYPQAEVRRRWPKGYDAIKGAYGAGRTWAATESGQSSRIPWAGMAGNQPLQPYYPKGQTVWVEFKEWRQVETYYDVATPTDPGMSYADALASTAQLAADYPDGVPTQLDPFSTVTYKSAAELAAAKDQHRATFGEDIPADMVAERPTLVYRYAYLCGDVELESGECPTGYWTIQFITGFRFPLSDKVTWRSLLSRMVDSQKWINVMMSALIRNIQINPKGVMVVEEGFFHNHDDAMASWASPGGLIRVRRGALTSGQKPYDFVQGGNSAYSQQLQTLIDVWREAIPRQAGFNPASLGQLGGDLRRISGEVVRQVQDAAMTSNAELFDALRHSRREGGRIFLSFLRKFFKMEDVIRVVGEDVAYEPVMQPAIDPTTGQPAHDPITGEALTMPVYDAQGQPQRRLVVPPEEAWHPDWWKEISIGDMVPTDDQLQILWKSLETSMPLLLQPRPDTGMPFFTSEDLVKITPNIPSPLRETMLQRIKAMTLMRLQQQWAQQQAGADGGGQQGQGQQGAGPPQGSNNGAGAPNSANGAGGPSPTAAG